MRDIYYLLKKKSYFILVFALLSQLSCEEIRQEQPLNIVWINAEDISPVFGCYGDSNAITPNIDRLADDGLVFNQAFTTSPVCSPSRSTFITGVHSTTLGSQHLRSTVNLPHDVKPLPALMKENGYFTTILGKTDYNFDPDGLWSYWEEDEAPWRKRKDGEPFFSTFTFGYSHEGRGNNYNRYLKMRKRLTPELIHDSLSVRPPVYFPDTPPYQNLWTRYYDLVSVFDQQVGTIIANLAEDDLLDNTIILIFSDHGFGMPRYKRWLYNTGIQVPLVVYLPEKLKQGKFSLEVDVNEKISFLDLAATTLSLANIPIPDFVQGRVFMGKSGTIEPEPEWLYATRDRTDNAYEMSRAVRNDDFIYIRHFMPYQPYIQNGKIFSDEKESFKYLRIDRDRGSLPPQTEQMFLPKPVEELYDLRSDPAELNNVVNDSTYGSILEIARQEMKRQAIETRDLGFLHETEVLRRAKGTSPYEVGLNDLDIENLFQAANKIGLAEEQDFLDMITSSNPGIRYWGLIGLKDQDRSDRHLEDQLMTVLDDISPANQILAADLILKNGSNEKALSILESHLLSDSQANQLMAARTLELTGEMAWTLMPSIQKVLGSYRSDERRMGLPYTDYNYAAFISWSLEPIVKSYEDSQKLLANY